MTRVIASIEARMNASRLPNKVLLDIGGEPALGRMVHRLQRCRGLDGIVVATTINPADDAIEAWAREVGVACHRGSEEDVLRRVVDAQRGMGADVVVELCGDCPLIDPDLVDLGVETFLARDCDVVTSAVEPSFPQGTEVQVFSLAALEEVADTVTDPAVREHVSLYFYENPERYHIVHLDAAPDQRHPEVRLQMDYPQDLELIRMIYARLEPLHGDAFGLGEIVRLLVQEPWLTAVNSACQEKPAR